MVDFKFKLNLTYRDPYRENVKFTNLVKIYDKYSNLVEYEINIPDRIGVV